MDLLDFEGQAMYFDEAMPAEVTDLINKASEEYSNGKAEAPLLRAYLLAPRSLTVLVALYRFYYYQQRLSEAISIAHLAMEVSGDKLELRRTWRDIRDGDIGAAVLQSMMGLVRFYLMALKGAGYLHLRLGQLKQGSEMLAKVVELDPHDHLRAKSLLDMANEMMTVTEHDNVHSIHGYYANSQKLSA